MTEHRLMGMATLALCHDSVIYSGFMGEADDQRNIPITDSTFFRVASISKTVTATAIMILYDQGLFKLDDDISNVLGYKIKNPKYPDISVTYRMLLSHTSSLQDGTGYSKFLSDTYYGAIPPKINSLLCDTGSYYSSDLWQEHTPGTYFTYCNLNFGILATLVEKLSNERFDVFCRKHIFEPLEMKASYRIQDVPNINNVAVLYRMHNGTWQPQADHYQGVMPPPRNLASYQPGDNGIIFGPQGSLRITLPDLAKFMRIHLNGGIYNNVRILKDSTVKLMHSPQWTYNGSNGDNYYGLFLQWGLGFQMITHQENGDVVFDDMNMCGHYGESYGLLGDMYFSVENDLGLIFITNGSEVNFDYGRNTAFYSLEEDVFETLYNSVQPCLYESLIPNKPEALYSNPISFSENNESNIRFYLPSPGRVQCKIYNSVGEVINRSEVIYDDSGRKKITIDKKGLNPGIYNCVISSEGNSSCYRFSISNYAD